MQHLWYVFVYLFVGIVVVDIIIFKRPPSDLQTLEIGRSLLPVLSDVMGVGGSATVFRVANFLLAFTQAKHLAVKRFNYSIV